MQAKVLPELSLPMFFKKPELTAKFQATNAKIGKPEKFDLHFEPPRTGTRMKVSLDICDYVPDKYEGKISFDEFTASAQPIHLDWNSRRGVFKLAN